MLLVPWWKCTFALFAVVWLLPVRRREQPVRIKRSPPGRK